MTESDKERFNARIRGEILISADARYVGTTTTQSVAEVKITDSSDLYDRISWYAFKHGEDLQGLFKTDKYLYMSCFIRDVAAFMAAFFREEELKPLFSHEYETAEFLISFPEKLI